MEPRHKKFWKAVGFIFLATGILVGGLAWGIESSYIETLPHEPNPSIGRTLPYNYHGIILWRSRKDKAQVDHLEYVAGFLVLSGILIAVFKCKEPVFVLNKPAPTLKLPKEFEPRDSGREAAFRYGLKLRRFITSLYQRRP